MYLCFRGREILREACEYCSLSWMQWISCSLHPHLISLLSASPPPPPPCTVRPSPLFSLPPSLPHSLSLPSLFLSRCTSSIGSSSLEHPCCCCCYKYPLVAVERQRAAGRPEGGAEDRTGQDGVGQDEGIRGGEDNKMTGGRARKRRRGEERRGDRLTWL